MEELLNRPLKLGDLALTKHSEWESNRMSEKVSYGLVIDETHLFINRVKGCKKVYLVENPSKQEEEIKKKLIEAYHIYLNEKREEDRIKKEERKKRVHIDYNVGDVLISPSDSSYLPWKYLYLGLYKIYCKESNEVKEGHLYLKYRKSSWDTIKSICSTYNNSISISNDSLWTSVESAIKKYMMSNLSLDEEIKYCVPILFTKEKSKRFSEVTRHINLIPSDNVKSFIKDGRTICFERCIR